MHNRPLQTSARHLAAAACLIASTSLSNAADMRPVDLIILGDSQLAFGSGPAMLGFFDQFSANCADTGLAPDRLKAVDAMSVGILGVRATGLRMWLSRTPKATRMICVRDPKGLSNASTYGGLRYRNSRWAQIGDSPHHQFCGNARSPLENIFAELPNTPKLVIFHFLGLSTFDWLDRAKLKRDLSRLEEQLPDETACLFLTTIPTYSVRINRPRRRAQQALAGALAETGSRCGFVAGHTARTLRACEKNRAYFRKRRNGSVKDPYHADAAGARRFLDLRGPAICRGVTAAVSTPRPALAQTPAASKAPQEAATPPLPMANTRVSVASPKLRD